MSSKQPIDTQTRRIPFLDVAVDVATFQESLDACIGAIESRSPREHVSINAGKCVLAHDDSPLAEMIKAADIINADGQSVVWAARLLGDPLPERVAGIDLMHAVLAESAIRAWPVYFLGAHTDVLQSAVTTLKTEHPSLLVAGTHDGYFADASAVAAAIGATDARVLFIAMPSPAKELFVATHRDTLGPVLTLGIGGSLDVVAGRTRRAPIWMQRSGLEWFYRFIQEPRRMWKRYLVGNTRFLALVLRHRFRH